MSLNRIFWTSTKWPKPPREYIFAGDALHTVGQTMFGPKWTGREPLANPTMGPNHNPHMAQEVAGFKIAAGEGHQRSVDAAVAENNAAWDRLKRTADWLADKGRNNDIKTFVRAKAGGEVAPGYPEMWNTDDPINKIFGSCSFLYRGKNWSPLASSVDSYVFFGAVSFEREIAALRTSPDVEAVVAGHEDIFLSPYIRLMLAVVRDLGMTESDQPKKSVVIESVEKLSGAFGLDDAKLLSPTATQYLAQFIRSPEKTLGRASVPNGSDASK